MGSGTARATEGYFVFRDLGTQTVSGKTKPISIYELVGPREKPETTHRITGLRAELTGRSTEMARLFSAVRRLRDGEGSVVSICGDPGTGKSRLVQEFKSTLDLDGLAWLEGHCYPYSQNISYFPLIDLMNRAWRIDEEDPPEKIRDKIEPRLNQLLKDSPELIPYIGSLYALSYPQIEQVSPEFWRSRFIDAVKAVVAALACRGPTVFCFEDIHWADQPTLDLLRAIMTGTRHPTLFLCVYRLPFSIFSDAQQGHPDRTVEEIRLLDLSPDDAHRMLLSLFRIKTIPDELSKTILAKAEGNPFYLEEITNSLMETGILIRENNHLMLTRPITESDVPSTVQGVIAARLDRLGREMKLVLQEASVIGRAFGYDVLKRISQIRDNIDGYLQGLERFDIIRAMSLHPELEYMFKHALTQEVVYTGLLKKERQEIHERIGTVMEQVFQDRLPEYYETLAFHFKQGRSVLKAVHYLMNSGAKSLNRFAVDPSHQYYREAFELLSATSDRTTSGDRLLIQLLLDWAFVFYYRADWGGFEDLLSGHMELAKSLNDKERLAMFYAWFGFSKMWREKFRESYHYLQLALNIGEEIADQRAIGYICTWLAWCCAELGLLDEGIRYGERAQSISGFFPIDQYLYFKSVSGSVMCHSYKGNCRKGIEMGKVCIDYGLQQGNVRCTSLGHAMMGFAHFNRGDNESAIESYKRAIEVAADPFYIVSWRSTLAIAYTVKGDFGHAEDTLRGVLEQCDALGYDFCAGSCQVTLALVSIAKGRMSDGMKILENIRQRCLDRERKCYYAFIEHVLGSVYLQMVQGDGDLNLSTVLKNIGFLIKTVPFASGKSAAHFHKAIAAAEEIGANGILGQAYLGLGRLHKAKKRKDKARECLLKAVDCLERCEAETILKQIREELISMD